MTGNELLEAILPDAEFLDSIFDAMEWAEEEIEKAQARHREQGRGPIWHSFSLIMSTHDKLRREVLYRAHCHEILERVARGKDTRPGTDAEMIVVLHESSLVGPLKSAAACLYFRLANRSIPVLARAVTPEIDVAAYEKLHGRVADDYEADLRRKLRQETRVPRS
ncbi:hypothetical protein [Streptomyces sp. NPDC056672]|uniref:hypothetical protein n=1 Tax=Streptomyces sp. NPDC056672 TaxID=3345906 RepID=UPI0036814DAB